MPRVYGTGAAGLGEGMPLLAGPSQRNRCWSPGGQDRGIQAHDVGTGPCVHRHLLAGNISCPAPPCLAPLALDPQPQGRRDSSQGTCCPGSHSCPQRQSPLKGIKKGLKGRVSAVPCPSHPEAHGVHVPNALWCQGHRSHCFPLPRHPAQEPAKQGRG